MKKESKKKPNNTNDTQPKSNDQFYCEHCDKDPKVWPHPLNSCDQKCWDRYYGIRDYE